MSDTIHNDAEGWWFWDETWADRQGPYPTEGRARKRLKDYAEYLNTGIDPEKEK